MTIKKLMSEIFFALLDPRNIIKVSNRNTITKLAILGKLFSIKILLSLFLLGIVKLVGIGNSNPIESMLNDFNLTIVLLVVIGISPLYEELIFRLPLRYNPMFIGVSVSLFFYFILGQYIFGTGYLNFDSKFLPKLLLSFFWGAIVFFLFLKNKSLKDYYENNFRAIYITSIVLFGFAHIRNLNLSLDQFYLIPLAISPHFIAGIILNYVRLKLDVLYCILFHGFNNLVAFIFNL